MEMRVSGGENVARNRVKRAVCFFQGEGGIRDVAVTGVQTCALPIYPAGTIISVAPADLANVLVHSGDPNTSDTMGVRAFEGNDWSAWAPIYFATTAANVSYGVVTLVNTGVVDTLVVQVAPGTPVVQIIPDVPLVAVAQPGPDTFLFHPNSGATAISHFDPSEDVIRFQGTSLADFAAVLDHTADNGHGDTVI